MNKIDWFYLRRPIILFLSAVVFAVSVSFVAYYYESQQAERFEQSMATLRSTHNLYRNIVNDLDLLEQYRTLYGGYKASGLVGEERRLSWIESLQGTNKAIRLPTMTYSLLPQEEFERPGFKAPRGVNVKSSPMRLSMGMLHEEDLFAVLEGLKRSIKNLFTVDSCSLKRNSGINNTLHTKRPNLQSDCLIRWVTIDAK